MLSRLVFFILFSISYADIDYITKKPCKDVDASQCVVNRVTATQCNQGPAFCVFKRYKKYGLTVNMTPHFTAKKVKVAMYADMYNDESYRTVVMGPEEACGLLPCPLHADNKTIFDINIMLSKRASGKFPVKVKVWDDENEAKACCFTFNVKVK